MWADNGLVGIPCLMYENNTNIMYDIIHDIIYDINTCVTYDIIYDLAKT